ncbi:hypothetical protein [Arthrobacter antioxidans]|uniref:hypothetical protein n=1 Tax=Arthrobacter antioxidans TaxID=2895818 RepID=UPI001FFFED50|nr:hypothetical protein [Arthrobacter antioxidans]
MPAILQLGCTIQCPHGGMVIAVPTNAHVRVGGAFALLQNDPFTVVGCPFTVGPKPQPCVKILWQAPAVSITVGGQAVLLASSIGLCQSAEQIVQGTVVVSGVQTKVSGV